MDNYGWVLGCYVHDIETSGQFGNHNHVQYCYFENGTKKLNTAIECGGSATVYGCIFDLDSTSNAIGANYSLAPHNIMNNTMLTSGTGKGIDINLIGSTVIIHSNYIEGFATGIGGLPGGAEEPYWIYNNRFFNNTTDIDTNLTSSSLMPADMVGENVALTATGLSKSGTKNVQNRFTYFAPVDTDTDMFLASYPKAASPAFADAYATVGALQVAGGGGGVSINPMHGLIKK